MNPRQTIAIARQALGQIAEHETNVLGDHLQALNRRLRIARKARSVGELLRDQIDLMADSRERLRRDQQRRQRLLGQLRSELRRSVSSAG